MKEKKVYVIQEIAGSADGRPKINIMGASSYSTTNDFIFLLPELSQIIFSPGPLIFKLRKGLKDIKTKWGAEEGTAGSFLSNVEVDNIARSSKEARKTVRQVLKKAYSQNKISQLEETAKRQGKSLDELVEFDVELSQRIYEGRNTSDFTPEEFWADIQKNRFKAEKSLYSAAR